MTITLNGTTKKSMENIILFLVFCFAISLFNAGGYIVAGLTLVYLIMNYKLINLTKNALFLMLFSATYMITYFAYFQFEMNVFVNFFWGPIACFLFSKLLVEKSTRKNILIILIAVISIGFFTHGILNFFKYITQYGWYYEKRIAVDVWRNEIISVTCEGMYFTFTTSMAIGSWFIKCKPIYKILLIIPFVLSLVATVAFSNRTLLYVSAILLIIGFIRSMASKEIPFRKKMRTVIIILVAAVIIIFVFATDLFGLTTIVQDSNIWQRLMDVESDGRVQIWQSFFEQCVSHPFGGQTIQLANEASYTHNLWLDVYYKTGLIPFVAIIIYTVRVIYQLFKLQKINDSKFSKIKAIFIFIYIGVIINFSVEPVFDGNPYFFLCFIMMNGAVEGYIERFESEKRELKI